MTTIEGAALQLPASADPAGDAERGGAPADAVDAAPSAPGTADLAALFHALPRPVLLLGADGRVLHANAACTRIWPGPPAELEGRPFLSLLTCPRARAWKVLHRALGGSRARFTARAAQGAGGRLRVTLLPATPGRAGLVAALVGPARGAPAADSAAASATGAEGRVPGFFFFRTDAEGRVAYASPGAEAVTGWQPDELVGHPLPGLEGTPPDARCTVALRRRDGEPVWVELLAGADPDAPAGGVQGVAREVTDDRAREERLLHGALHDHLTGLPNRALFFDRLDHTARAAAREPGALFAVLVVDLDDFKAVNDRLGHATGDRVLVDVAARLERSVRPGDTVCRLGGDEFTVLLGSIGDVSDASRVADRIRAELTAPFRLPPHELFLGTSIGIAVSATGYAEPADLLRDADTAMYRAKSLGKGRHEVFDAGMRDSTLARLQMETDLRYAVKRGELRLVYQPVVSLADGRIAAFEALLRWMHPSLGVLAPRDFLPVAEQTGLMGDLERWVLREACLQLGRWTSRIPGWSAPVSINLSERAVRSPALASQVSRTLAETRVDPALLDVEVGAASLADQCPQAEAAVRALSDAGVRIHVDHFGTGSTPLSLLGRVPVHALKFDRSFLEDCGSQSAVVRAVVTMAHALGAVVVAEGVETEEETAGVRGAGCDFAQGFRFSHPLDGEAAGRLVLAGERLFDTAPGLS